MIARAARPLSWRDSWDASCPQPAELRLYTFGLDLLPAELVEARACLGPGEEKASQAFATPLLAQRFIARRAWRRRILASIFKLDAAALNICQGPWGRPYLPGLAVQFSFGTSSRGGLGALVLGSCGQVSVDLEAPCGPSELQALAPLVLQGQVPGWRLLAWPRQRRSFLAAWVQLEACLKLSGQGFSAWQAAAIAKPRHSQLLALPGGTWLCVAAEQPWTSFNFHHPPPKQELIHA